MINPILDELYNFGFNKKTNFRIDYLEGLRNIDSVYNIPLNTNYFNNSYELLSCLYSEHSYSNNNISLLNLLFYYNATYPVLLSGLFEYHVYS